MKLCSLVLAAAAPASTFAWTGIKVINEWNGGLHHSDLNVKIHGEGVGGCDIVMHPANSTGPQEDDSSCKCLWGTVNYELSVWLPAIDGGDNGTNSSVEALPFCSDTRGLGNCYHGPYTCTIGSDKLCHCTSASEESNMTLKGE